MGLLSAELSIKKMAPLCRQLATSYSAGIPIIQSLDLIGENMKDREVKELLHAMKDDLRGGSTLEEAAHAQSKKLPVFFIHLLATGEKGGKLDVMLKDLANYFEDQLELRRQIRSAMIYPMIQLIFAWYLGSFALRIAGQFSGLLDSRGGGGFDLGNFFAEYMKFQITSTLIFALIVGILIILSRLGLLKWMRSGITTYVWPISIVTRKFALARFFRSLSLLIGSGLSITQAIKSAAAVTANPYIERDLLQAVPLIKQGSTLSEALGQSRTLTPMAREMVFIGEHSGKLEEQLHKASMYHLDEANQAVALATRVGNALIVLLVAGTIGYIVIKFYSSYFNLLGDLLDGI